MANPTFRVSVVSRGGGRSALATAAYDSGSRLSSAVASAAYRSGETLHDTRANKTFDYTRKEDILHTEILAPDHAPDWVTDRQTLWNAVETSEKRKDAQLARSIIAALPRELDTGQNIKLVQEYVREQFVSRGMIADFALHDKDASDGGRNPHVHIMLTLRDVTPSGFGKKNRDWNQRELLEGWRDAWEQTTNRYLGANASASRVSLKSYEKQGISKTPGQHLGYEATALERKGVRTRKAKRNREIRHGNAVQELARMRQPLYTGQEIAAYYRKQAARESRLDEPDTAWLDAHARKEAATEKKNEEERETFAARITRTNWFGWGARTTQTYYPGMSSLPKSEREKLDALHRRTPEGNPQALHTYHGRTLRGLLSNTEAGISRDGIENLRRLTQVIREKAAAYSQRAAQYTQQAAERYTSWRERQQHHAAREQKGGDRER